MVTFQAGVLDLTSGDELEVDLLRSFPRVDPFLKRTKVTCDGQFYHNY